MLLLLGWENICSLHPIFTLPYSKAVLLHRWQLSVELIKLFALHWMSLSFTHLMLTYTQEDWPTRDWLFSIPGLTWRQIVTGLADDCSSLIGAVSRRPSERLAATECVRHHLRSAANNPGQQSPDTSWPLLSWWVSSSELLFKGFPNTIQRYKARYPWKEISIF